MTIEKIDRDRTDLQIDQKTLCTRAGVHETTYSAIKNGRSSGTGSTLKKLAEAIEALRQERAKA